MDKSFQFLGILTQQFENFNHKPWAGTNFPIVYPLKINELNQSSQAGVNFF